MHKNTKHNIKGINKEYVYTHKLWQECVYGHLNTIYGFK